MGSNCDARTLMTTKVQNALRPGRIVQPATMSASSAGATRLRRRLSRIFHRPISGSGLRVQPRRGAAGGLLGMPALLDVAYGDGHIAMIGFRAQNRAQAYGTFKVLFNALYRAGAVNVPTGGAVTGR